MFILHLSQNTQQGLQGWSAKHTSLQSMQPQTNPQSLYLQAHTTEQLERMYYGTQSKPTY